MDGVDGVDGSGHGDRNQELGGQLRRESVQSRLYKSTPLPRNNAETQKIVDSHKPSYFGHNECLLNASCRPFVVFFCSYSLIEYHVYASILGNYGNCSVAQ